MEYTKINFSKAKIHFEILGIKMIITANTDSSPVCICFCLSANNSQNNTF